MNISRLASSILNSTGVHKYEDVEYYLNIGQVNDRGIIKPVFEEPVSYKAQVQSGSGSDIRKLNDVDENSVINKFYINMADAKSLNRVGVKGSDFLKYRGEYFRVFSTEDFSRQGWQCLTGTRQLNAPFETAAVKSVLDIPDAGAISFDFLHSVLSDAVGERIYRTRQPYVSLPSTYDYITFDVVGGSLRGTAETEIISAGDVDSEKLKSALTRTVVVNFYGESGALLANRTALEFNSPRGADFFKKYNIGIMFSDDIESTAFESGEGLLVEKNVLTLYLDMEMSHTQQIETFDNVKVNIKRVLQ